MSKPIIFFTFANDQTAHLDLLKAESRAIKEALFHLEKRNFLRIEREESANLSDIIKTLSNFQDQIVIFHFAGHAGGQEILLEQGSARAPGLAQLLAEQTNLKLVFLNGCSTAGQVQFLLDAGVRAVVATSVPVGDQIAKDFSTAFYQYLANKRSLSRAFELAKSAIDTKYKNIPPIQIKRGIGFRNKETTVIPWGLYVQDDSVLNWTLPYYQKIDLPKDLLTYIGQKVDVNKHIVLVLEEMCNYNPDIYHQMKEVKDGEERKKDSSAFLSLVIQNFPWLIGSQIQLLQQKSELNEARLEQLLSTYMVTSQVLYFILLSDFWDEANRLSFDVPESFLARYQQSKTLFLRTDFLDKTLQLCHLMKQNEARFFVPEYEKICLDLTDENSFLHKAWRYIEQIREQRNPLPNLSQTLFRLEQAVAILLRAAAFLSNYQMLTIRDISIDHPRNSHETYELNMGRLNARYNDELSLYQDAENRRKQTYSNSCSIVLVPSEKHFNEFLNLSPFIIDKNSFLEYSNIDPFLYAYEDGQAYYYLAVKHSVFTALKNEKGTDVIHTQMSLEDFEEGRSYARGGLEDDFGFGEAFSSSGSEINVEKQTKVFENLEQLFEQFKTCFTPKPRQR